MEGRQGQLLKNELSCGRDLASALSMETSVSLEDNNLDWSLSSWRLQPSNEAEETPLQCVGSLQINQKPHVGFLCGSLPVPTDTEATSCMAYSFAEAAIISATNIQNNGIIAPQYKILPNQTDLNRLFLSEVQCDLVLPVASRRAPEGVHELCKAWGNNYHAQPLARKCEALAVSGLARCNDQIDVIAPVEILKKIFKIPYSKARLSIAVHRVGKTLILNTGPDVDEGERVMRAKKSQAQAKAKSLFLKFAMQSVRAEACDCPASSTEDQKITSKSCLDVLTESHTDSLNTHGYGSQWNHSVDCQQKKRTNDSTNSLNNGQGHSQQDAKHTGSLSSSVPHTSGVNSFKTSHLLGEQKKDSHFFPSDSGNHKSPSSENFLRVLFWQLEEVKMLLGSDLLLFSNEKHLAVSLHLWETQRQVTPLMWLDAWLDNVMASVPELAICYHHNGIVQGYELLKTDDIFLLKGLSEDGTSFFHPHVVRQNALSVLKFLQENCKQDFGTYWLFKNSGEDLVQLFDLSVMSRDCTPTAKKPVKKDSLSSSWSRSKGSCSLPLGILLYRLAHRLSLSQDPVDRCKCANFFKNCLKLLGEEDHLFVQASAHEHVARLILKHYEELGSLLGPLLLEANESDDITSEEKVLINTGSLSQIMVSDTHDSEFCKTGINSESALQSSQSDSSVIISCKSRDAIVGQERRELRNAVGKTVQQEWEWQKTCCMECPTHDPGLEASPVVQRPLRMVETNLSPSLIGLASAQARLTAVHHVSQAIKALRWQRQLQDVDSKLMTSDDELLKANHHIHVVPVCIHGELDLVEYFNIRDYEIGPFRDNKLSQLVLLLGESYLALGLAYKAEGELDQALKAIELACSVYGSMPLHLHLSTSHAPSGQNKGWAPMPTSRTPLASTCVPNTAPQSFCRPLSYDSEVGWHAEQHLFWSQAWVLVGDIHVEYQKFSVNNEKSSQKIEQLAIAEEVVKEVKRLRKRLSHGQKGCDICSLTNCSCENDRTHSNISASSSTSYTTSGRNFRYVKRSNSQVVGHGCAKKIQQKQVAAADSSLSNLNSSKDSSTGNKKASDILSKLERGSNQVNISSDTPNKQATKSDIFSYVKGPRKVSREKNLVTALACYDAAIIALTEVSENLEETKFILRKKGWTYNEIGRMKLACGNTISAKVEFKRAIDAFKEAKDQTNVVLIYINMAHGLRAAAESLVSQLDSVKTTILFEHISKTLFDDAKSWYLDALRVYGQAKNGLELLSEDNANKKVSLVNEVLTQLAHTYLRLGMLLAREDGDRHPAFKFRSEASSHEHSNTEAACINGTNMTANDAIREAIALYESLGSLRAQELAFAQFQLACYHKACCLATMKLEESKPNNAVLLQQWKRYLSLADRCWLKALRHYKWSTHPDMFLDIQMQRSDLHVRAASASNSLQLLEVALSHLLEARHVMVFRSMGSKSDHEPSKPSEAVCNRFVQKLQSLLKEMLLMARNLQNTSSSKSVEFQTKNLKIVENKQKREVYKLNLAKVKEMYRLSLKPVEMLDFRKIYEILSS